jgi:hypothetical protein
MQHIYKHIPLVYTILFLVLFPIAQRNTQQQGDLVVIVSPQKEQVLQGVVVISGSSSVDYFQSSEVSFSYNNDPTDTWFLIRLNDQEVKDGTLATWDTTILTDHIYTLRLRVKTSIGSVKEIEVKNLHVRNYSMVETKTPEQIPSINQRMIIPTVAQSINPYSESNIISHNTAAINELDIYTSMAKGALVVFILFSFSGVIISLRHH